MNPESHKAEESFSLPQPEAEYGDANEFANGTAEDRIAASLEQGVSAANPFIDPASQAVHASTPGTPLLYDDPTNSSSATLLADDSDLIEKEWVDKAKYIVEHTKHDPYTQNKEINRVKADYLKKRYNRDLKLSDD